MIDEEEPEYSLPSSPSILEIRSMNQKNPLITNSIIYEQSKIPPFVQAMEMEDKIVKPDQMKASENNGVADQPVPDWAVANFVSPDFVESF